MTRHRAVALGGILVVGQLSALLGPLFALSGRNLWTVILCHGLYDTVAFIRYATGVSRNTKT